jgi:hypothetical protein
MTSESRLITFALNSYPSWWRERYRDEVLLLMVWWKAVVHRCGFPPIF